MEEKKQILAHDISRWKSLLKELEVKDAVQHLKVNSRKAVVAAAESETDSESETFMFSKTRFNGGGPRNREGSSDESSSEEEISVPPSQTQQMTSAEVEQVAKHLNQLEKAAIRITAHLTNSF